MAKEKKPVSLTDKGKVKFRLSEAEAYDMDIAVKQCLAGFKLLKQRQPHLAPYSFGAHMALDLFAELQQKHFNKVQYSAFDFTLSRRDAILFLYATLMIDLPALNLASFKVIIGQLEQVLI